MTDWWNPRLSVMTVSARDWSWHRQAAIKYTCVSWSRTYLGINCYNNKHHQKKVSRTYADSAARDKPSYQQCQARSRMSADKSMTCFYSVHNKEYVFIDTHFGQYTSVYLQCQFQSYNVRWLVSGDILLNIKNTTFLFIPVSVTILVVIYSVRSKATMTADKSMTF